MYNKFANDNIKRYQENFHFYGIRDDAKYFKVDVASLMDISDSNTNSKDKIRLITEGCGHLLDNDLNFILRLVSIMREEYVKRD